MSETTRPLDPQEQLRLIDEQRVRARRATEPSAAGILAVWGVAWFVGYLTIHLTGTLFGGPGWAWIVFGVVMMLALLYTVVVYARSQSGMRGPTRTVGTLYSVAWVIAFTSIFLFAGRIAELIEAAGVPAAQLQEIHSVLMNLLVCLVIGVIYMVGNALWRSPVEWALGAWIIAVAVAATLAPFEWVFLIMAVAGGGGFLLGAAVLHFRGNRRHRPVEEGSRR